MFQPLFCLALGALYVVWTGSKDPYVSNKWFFDTQGKRANQVSSFENNMNRQKISFLNGFLSRCREKLKID